MASRGDIEAGKAHIMLYLKNSALVKGLNSIKQELQGLGTNIMGIGARLMGLGASIAAPLALAVLHFSAVGSELADLSARTGESAGSLAELKFAAEQTGSGLEDVEKAILKMQKSGSTLTFDQMAAKIAAVEDPAKRTRMAVEAWGKSGTKLLPLVDSLQQLRQEARDLGLVPTEEAVGMADAIGDSLDKVKAVASATVFEIGAALAPVLLPALDVVKNIAGWFNRWAKENGAVIRTVAMIAVGLIGAGAVIVGIGATIFAIGTAFGLLATTITGVGAVLGFLLNPLTLLIAALGVGIFLWARFTESGRASVQGLMDFFAPLLATVMTTIGGISDALMAGDLTLAGQIAVTGLRLVFLQGLQQIANLFGQNSEFGAAITNIGGKLLRGDLQGAWDSVVKNMAAVWDGFVAGIVNAFTTAAKILTDIWAGLAKKVSDTIVDISSKNSLISKALLDVDVSAEEKRRQALNAQGARLPGWNGAENMTAAEQIKAGAREGIDQKAESIKSVLDAVNAAVQAKAEESAAAAHVVNIAGASEASDDIKRLTQELAQLRQQAAVAREAANLPKAPGAGAGLPDLQGAKASFGTFSAAAAVAAGGGGGGDRVAKTLVEMKRERKDQYEKEMELRRQTRRDIKEALRNRMRA